MNKKGRYTIENVREIFDKRGCKLLSSEYVRQKDKLSYVCVCGNESTIALDKFLQGQLCRACRGERANRKKRHSYEYVRKVFEDGGATLLSKEYKNGHTRMDYICECGNESKISFSKFQAGQRCFECRNRKISKRLSGPNSYMYKHDKDDSERVRHRKYPEYYEWRRKVFKRDDYICQNCGEKGGNLNAHHIEAYSRAVELRTCVDNGITLCEDCHKDYHRDFYKNDADESSLHEFIRGEYRIPECSYGVSI